MSFPLLQIAEQKAGEAGTKDMSMLDLLMSGGIVMAFIAVISIVAVYLIIERWMYIRKVSKISPQNIQELKNELRNGKVIEAKAYCKSTGSAWGRIFGHGVNGIGEKYDEIESRLEDSASIEIARMESGLNYISLIAGLAPLLGFVGTIAGVLTLFHDISITPDITIATISAGLYKKMITSAAGLIVGIIAYSGYNILQARIDKFANKVQEDAMDFKAVLQNKE
jgi:biopolymer transport protein ExbB